MAKWTLSDFISNLRQKIDDQGEDTYTDDELTMYINSGVFDLSRAIQNKGYAVMPLRSTSTVDLLGPVYIIDPTSGYIPAPFTPDPSDPTKLTPPPFIGDLDQLQGVYIDGTKIAYGTVADKMSQRDIVTLWGDKMMFGRAKTGTLEVFYTTRAKPMVADTDTCIIPEQYQWIVLDFAEYECKRKDGDEGQAMSILSDYERKKMMVQDQMNDLEIDDEPGYVSIKYFEWGSE